MSKVQKPQIIAGEAALLARRYARALLELAQEKKVVEAVEADLVVLRDVAESDMSFIAMANHPRLTIKSALRAVESMIEKAKLNELTAAFLRQVVKARRLALLGLIIEVFDLELATKRDQHTVVVTTPQALSPEQEATLAKQLGTIVGGSVQLYVEEDKSILGGLVIKMGSRLIDASIKGKLARLERQLKMQQEAA